MTTEGKVSPLPWVCERTLVVNGLGYEVSLYEHRHEIVRAVNAHDRLVAAIELILHSFDDGPPSLQSIRLDDACKKAQELLAALAAAKEG